MVAVAVTMLAAMQRSGGNISRRNDQSSVNASAAAESGGSC